MNKISSALTRRGFCFFGFTLFIIGLLVTFSPVLPKSLALVSPDAMPFFVYPYGTLQAEGLLTGSTFTPHILYWLLFDPLIAHELAYMVDTLVLVLGAVYYLRGRNIHPLAAWCGGLALGFSGYTFTLFCAGHRGYFHMFSCAVWVFGLLASCFETRKLFCFAMLGLVLAWGVPLQPDVLLMLGMFAVAYAVWLTVRHGCQAADGSGARGSLRSIWDNMVAVWPRFAVSVLVLALVGFGGIRAALTTHMASREAQITGSMGLAASANTKQGKRSAAEEHSRWLFATNWSLPPEDILEFVAPGVFGNETMQAPFPYWGRLGRPADELFQKGRMMPNYRQHTVYIGVIPIVLALFGVIAFFSGRRKADFVQLKPGSEPSLSSQASRASGSYSDVPFWCAVWTVALLFALGRYTPVYRLFYSIPYLDYIRCPVKFLHVAEIATAFLAAFGADALLRAGDTATDVRRKLVWLAGGGALLLAILALFAVVAQPQIVRHVTELGLAQVAQALSGYAVQNLLRASGLAALVAGVAFALSRPSGGRWLVCGTAVLMVAFVADQAEVAKRYVKVIDVGPLYRENSVVKAIKKSSGGQVVNTINYVTPNEWGQDWFSCSLLMNGVRNMMPSAEERVTPYGHLFESLQNDVKKLWRVFNVQYVVVPRKGAESLVRSGVIWPVIDFELGAGVVRQVQPSESSLVLASVAGSVAGARAFGRWKGGVSLERQVSEVAQSQTVVTLAPESPSGALAVGSMPRLTGRGSAWGTPWQFETRLTCEADGDALVVFNQKFEEGWEVRVDQKPVPCYPADGFWLSAVVPAGAHDVVARKIRSRLPGVLSFSGSLALLVVGVFCRFFRRTPSSSLETRA